VMASFKALDDGTVELWVANDTLAPISLKVKIVLATLVGSTLSTTPVQASVPATSSVVIWRGHPAAAPDHVLMVRSPQLEGNRHFFAAIKELPIGTAAPTMAVEQMDSHTLEVTLSASHYVYGARLLCSHAATRFSDNFVDLCAGESRSITVGNPVIVLTPGDVTLRHGISEGGA
jgi:beta-mannosidase